MAKMSIMEKIYFISAWVIAGCATLTFILTAVAYRNNALLAFGSVLDWIAIGITGCFVFLHLSGWFRNNGILFTLAWVVGGILLLSMILTAGANLGGVGTVAVFFEHILLIVFFTLLLLHLSGKVGKINKIETSETKDPVK